MNITLLTDYYIDKIIKSSNTIIYFDLYDDNCLKLDKLYLYETLLPFSTSERLK